MPAQLSGGSIPCGKRVVDVLGATLAMLLLWPVMLAAALAVRLSGAGPILFRQIRVGQGERPFVMLKFRTMYADSDDRLHRAYNCCELAGEVEAEDGIFKPAADPRITPIGRILRRYSIDELPQLLNVLGGEMSLVGPRPALPWEVELFTPEQRARHRCRPGMTGLWQVSGRNRLSMSEMLALDLAYARQVSLVTDLRILLRTPAAALFDRGTR